MNPHDPTLSAGPRPAPETHGPGRSTDPDTSAPPTPPTPADSVTADAGAPTADVPVTAAAADVPAAVGRYRIQRLLGKGGMGAVYLAHDPELDRPVALKVPRVVGAEAGERFLREARAAAAVSHPNLCPVYDAGRADGALYLAMAYVPGSTLAQMLRDAGPLPPDRAAALAVGIARGMAEAHRHGVVHRDLKPGNVLLNRNGEPVVTDFGLALRSGVIDLPADPSETAAHDPRLTRAGMIMGTPAYMPPEQARGEVEKVGPAADVYALGAILHELLTGKTPFRAESVAELLRKIETDLAPAPSSERPGIPAGLDAVVRRALTKDPAGRFPSMGAFAEALAPFAAPPRRGRWRGVALAAAFAVVAFAAGVVFYVQTDNGTVEVRLNDPAANVQVAVDGNDLTVTDGTRVTKLRAGAHALEVKGPDFETETRVFRVKRGEKTVLEIELKPKPKSPPDPKVDPKPPTPAEPDKNRARLARLLASGRQLIRQGSFAGLDAVVAEALKIDPESPGALALRATFRIAVQKDVVGARADAEAALKLNPETYHALFVRGYLNAEDGKLDEGIADITAALRLEPTNPSAWAQRANSYGAKEEYLQAVADATRSLEYGKLREAYVNRGTAYACLGEYEKALADFDEAVRIAPNHARVFNLRSAVHDRMGNADKSAADWATAKRLEPALGPGDRKGFPDPPKQVERKKLSAEERASFDTAFDAAQKAWDGDRFDDCGKALEKAVGIDPTSAPARSLRARLWTKLGRAEQARAEANEAIRLDPNDPWAYMTRGVLAGPEKNPAAAVADYTIALRIDPKNHAAWNNRGWAYFNRGQYHQAVADLDEAIRLNPDYAPAYSNRGACELYLGRYEQAEADYGKAIEAAPLKPQWLVIRSAIRAKRGNLAGAAADRKAAIALKPELENAPGFTLPVPLPPVKLDPEVEPDPKAEVPPKSGPDLARLAQLLANGRRLVVAGRYTDLEAVADEAVSVDPQSPGAFALRATVKLTQRKDRAGASADAEAALKLNPDTSQALVVRACLSGIAGKPDDAIADLTAAIRVDPKNAGAYQLRSQAYLDKKEYRQAVADATRAIELGHSRPDPYVNRATAHAFLGEYAKAIADYDAAIALIPTPDYYIQRSTVYAKMGNVEKSGADWEAAKKLVPNLPEQARLVLPDPPKPPERKKLSMREADELESTLTQAVAALDRSRYTDCLKLVDEALRLDPTSAAAQSLRSRALFQSRQYPQSEAAANEALRLDPTDAWAYSVRGSIKSNRKDYVGAVADHTIALTLNPSLFAVWNNRGLAYARLGHFHQGLADLDEAVRLRPAFPGSYPNRAVCHLNLGDYDKALADYRKTAEAQPSNARWRLLCAALCARLGDKDGEAKELALAVEVDPKLKDAPYPDLPVPLPPVKKDPQPDPEPGR